MLNLSVLPFAKHFILICHRLSTKALIILFHLLEEILNINVVVRQALLCLDWPVLLTSLIWLAVEILHLITLKLLDNHTHKVLLLLGRLLGLVLLILDLLIFHLILLVNLRLALVSWVHGKLLLLLLQELLFVIVHAVLLSHFFFGGVLIVILVKLVN